jgi:hypothetical protein
LWAHVLHSIFMFFSYNFHKLSNIISVNYVQPPTKLRHAG